MYHVAEGLIVKLGKNIVLETPQGRTVLFDNVEEFHMAGRKALMLRKRESNYLFFKDIFAKEHSIPGIETFFGVYGDRFVVRGTETLDPEHFRNTKWRRVVPGNPPILYSCDRWSIDLAIGERHRAIYRDQHPVTGDSYPVAVNGALVVLKADEPPFTIFYDFVQNLMRRIYGYAFDAIRPFRQGFIGVEREGHTIFNEEGRIIQQYFSRLTRNIIGIIEIDEVIVVETSKETLIGTDLSALRFLSKDPVVKTPEGCLALIGKDDYTMVYDPTWSLPRRLSVVHSRRAFTILLCNLRANVHLTLFLKVMAFTHL